MELAPVTKDEVAREGGEEPEAPAPAESEASEPEVLEGGASEETPAEEEEAGGKTGPGEELDDAELVRRAAALLFAAGEPLGLAALREFLERPDGKRVRTALETLASELEASSLPLVLRCVAGRWRLLTDPELVETVERLNAAPGAERITPAALETLTIVAYRQPVTKAEVEAIRGVQSGPLLRSLVDRGLARVTGRADQPGSPLQYGTTREFLERFGLASLKDLPRDGELASD